jgi:Zn-dependent protease
MMSLSALGQIISVWFIPAVLAITLHEAAHGWGAERLGDNTARLAGRVTFNPIRHVDPFGTLVLPGLLLLAGAPFLFGWAKPVPVAFHRLRHPKRDMIWVALAGPGMNIALGIAAALLLHISVQLPGRFGDWTTMNLQNAVIVNVVLAAFNMLPLLPLDGGRVVAGLLPDGLARRYARSERYGLLILIGIAFLVPMVAGQLGYAINPLADMLLPIINAAYTALMHLAGW